MRHMKRGRRLGRASNKRKAMMRQLVGALFLHGRIKTTVTRAKELRPAAERIITWAKRGSLHNRRQALRIISRTDIVNRIFDNIAEWYKDRPGGYTRIIKMGPRKGDAAPMAFIELVDWVTLEKLPGQMTKAVKVVEGEEGAKPKEKKKLSADKKAAKPGKKKVTKKTKEKDPEKEKKISERKTEKEKTKKERAQKRDAKKKELAEVKAKQKTETKNKTTKKKAKAKVKTKAKKKKVTKKTK